VTKRTGSSVFARVIWPGARMKDFVQIKSIERHDIPHVIQMMQNDPTMTCIRWGPDRSGLYLLQGLQPYGCPKLPGFPEMENTQENIQAMMPLMSTNCRQFVCKNGSKCFTPQNIRPSYEDHRDRSRS